MRSSWYWGAVAIVGGTAFAAAVACGDSAGDESTFPGGAGGGDGGGGGREAGISGGFGEDDAGARDGGFDPDAACGTSTADAKRSGVDLVFVIDNSHSMADEIRKVLANLNAFAGAIANSGVDYRVIVLSAKGTELNDAREDVPNVRGCTGVTGDYPREVCAPQPLAGPGCADGPRFFHLDHFPYGVASTNAMSLILGMYPSSYSWGPSGNGCANKPNEPAGGGWSRWVRFDTTKFFVVITDDDAKTPTATATEEVHQVFDRKLLELGPPGTFGTASARKYVYNAVVGWYGYPGGRQTPPVTGLPQAVGCTSTTDAGPANFAMNQGDQHRKLAALTGGVVDSICKDDWSPILANLAQSVITRIGCEYEIQRPPGATLDPGKASVRYTPTSGAPEMLNRVAGPGACTGPRDWYYDDNNDPKKVFLCPAACSSIGNNAGGRIDVLIACGGLIVR